jgi:D-alanine-D-alanine ligase
VFLDSLSGLSLDKAFDFFSKHGDVFIKAASQGSSIGCYHVTEKNALQEKLEEAFRFGPYVLIEKTIKARELEVAVFETKDGPKASAPGEIICPSQFYSFEEKYAQTSHTQTHPKAKGLSSKQVQELQEIALKAFQGLKLKHLARIDFFLTSENQIYLNEINTFPGMTPISLFPAMVEASGLTFQSFLTGIIKQSCQKKDHS